MNDLNPFKLPPDLFRVYTRFKAYIPSEDIRCSKKTQGSNEITLRMPHNAVYVTKLRDKIRMTCHEDSPEVNTRRYLSKEFPDREQVATYAAQRLGAPS